jgi:hypothetical protein
VEISPAKANTKDVFLNVLSVTDGKKLFQPVKTNYVSSQNFDGVIVSDNDGKESTLVLFCKDTDLKTGKIKLPENRSFQNVLITGLPCKTAFKVKHSKNMISITQSTKGENISSDQGTLYLKM